MRLRKTLQLLALALLALVLGLVVAVQSLLWYFNPPSELREDVVYGESSRGPLTMDVLLPETSQSKNRGVIMIISGSWRSNPDGSKLWLAAPLVRAGYTIFAVSHDSQPKAEIHEIIAQLHRAVRFIRHHADDYAIDPDALGITGGSSGGHLSLMLATGAGAISNTFPLDPTDPVDRQSSTVQAAAVFFPVTDLLNLGPSTQNPGDGGPPISFVKAFGPDSKNMARWKEIGRRDSPIYHVHTELPPILIHHGDADTLVPLEQSERFLQRTRAIGIKPERVTLHVHPHGRHGWLTFPLDILRFARFYDRHLLVE